MRTGWISGWAGKRNHFASRNRLTDTDTETWIMHISCRHTRTMCNRYIIAHRTWIRCRNHRSSLACYNRCSCRTCNIQSSMIRRSNSSRTLSWSKIRWNRTSGRYRPLQTAARIIDRNIGWSRCRTACLGCWGLLCCKLRLVSSFCCCNCLVCRLNILLQFCNCRLIIADGWLVICNLYLLALNHNFDSSFVVFHFEFYIFNFLQITL